MPTGLVNATYELLDLHLRPHADIDAQNKQEESQSRKENQTAASVGSVSQSQ